MLIKELDKLRQEQSVVAPPGPDIPTNGLVVYLNADTMFNTGTTLATDGQPVANWGNFVTGNNVSGATQGVLADQPIMNIVDGIKQLDFSASSSVRLTLGQPTELNFPSSTGRYTFMAQCGTGTASVFWWSNITGSNTGTGQGAFDFFNNRAFYADGDTFRSVLRTIPVTPTVITVARGIAGENVELYIDGISQLSSTTNGSVEVLTNDWLIGGTNGTTANAYQGTMRNFIVYNRVLTAQEVTDINTVWTT